VPSQLVFCIIDDPRSARIAVSFIRGHHDCAILGKPEIGCSATPFFKWLRPGERV